MRYEIEKLQNGWLLRTQGYNGLCSPSDKCFAGVYIEHSEDLGKAIEKAHEDNINTARLQNEQIAKERAMYANQAIIGGPIGRL